MYSFLVQLYAICKLKLNPLPHKDVSDCKLRIYEQQILPKGASQPTALAFFDYVIALEDLTFKSELG